MEYFTVKAHGQHLVITTQSRHNPNVEQVTDLEPLLSQYSASTSLAVINYIGSFDYRSLRCLPQITKLDLVWCELDYNTQVLLSSFCPKLQTLILTNPYVEGSLDELWAGLSELTELTIYSSDGEIEIVRQLPPSLTYLKLERVEFSTWSEVSLPSLQVLELISVSGIEDLPPCPNLHTLVLDDMEPLYDISSLSSGSSLTSLTINRSGRYVLPPLPLLTELITDCAHVSNGRSVTTIEEYQASWRSAKSARGL